MAGDGWGGYVQLAYRPRERVAWWWAAVVGLELPLVMIRADDLRIPGRGMEVRGDGVWACLTCEAPMEHWSVGLECFAVSLDEPSRAWGDERGDRVPFGLDLEWEAAASPVGTAEGEYEQWCRVSGEVLLGDDRIDVTAAGWRVRRWGAGVPVPGWRVGAMGWRASGEVWPGGGKDVWPAAPAEVDDRLVTPVAWSPMLVPWWQVAHALCSVEPGGWGWGSWATQGSPAP